jgi:serine/threonine-protein kinase
MSHDPHLQQLLDELFESRATPEEVCKSCPELLPTIREHWRKMCRVQAELDALFPDTPNPDATPPTHHHEGVSLPTIPGYEVEAVLGHGGMGVVFRARQLRLNRVVALKMALASAYAGTHERERFQREAEAVAQLRHPNVVQIYEIGDPDGRPYFTMELVEGGSLAQKLSGTPQPARHAAAFVATLAGAVWAAHQAGIVHRDLKPANILLEADTRTVEDGTSGPSDMTTVRLHDFRPKISDFGLARRLDAEPGLTRTGAALGTPSYMAPEQAQGKADAIGPAVDIYALGAILYELLTGRPPFRGETSAETLLQVLIQQPVPPSRLNPKVPRDLETICLHCLHKEPQRRYVTAAALAKDLDCFLHGETISARPEGSVARLARRIRRRPMLSAAVMLSTLLLIVLVGGGLWVISERAAQRRATAAADAATERAANDDVQEMIQWLNKSAWPEAHAALERAKGRLGTRGSHELRQRMDKGQRELDLGLQLDAIVMGAYDTRGGEVNFATGAELEAAFRDFGLGKVHEDPDIVASRIRESHIRNALVVALDQWVSFTGASDQMNWILAVIQKAEPDSSDWRKLASDPANWKDKTAFAKLLATTPVATRAIPILLALERQMTSKMLDTSACVKQLQLAYPGDFRVNLRMGGLLASNGKHEEAIRYFQAVLAVRPSSVFGYHTLGDSLQALGRYTEAVEQYKKLLELAPTRSSARAGLVTALWQMGQYEEANTHLRHLLAHDAAYVGRTYPLRAAMIQRGMVDEVLAAWKAAIDAFQQHDIDYGYAEFCLFLGREDEYRRAREDLITRFGTDPAVYVKLGIAPNPFTLERTARACLLQPVAGDELRKAVALTDYVVALDRSKYVLAYPYFRFAQGLAQYRQGQFDLAISTMRGDASTALGPAPRLVLAMALHKKGRVAEARHTLAAAVLAHDWRANQVRDQDDWIYHALRREAEGIIMPKLPGFLEGMYQHKDNDERLTLLGVCQFTNRTLAVAHLYSDAFATDPRLAEDPAIGNRYSAARAAAMVGCGHGTDVKGMSEEERRRWRDQARRWLQDDLTAWDKLLVSNPDVRLRAAQALSRWRSDPDLACLRDPAELAKLSDDERRDYLVFWTAVGGTLERCGNVK